MSSISIKLRKLILVLILAVAIVVTGVITGATFAWFRVVDEIDTGNALVVSSIAPNLYIVVSQRVPDHTYGGETGRAPAGQANAPFIMLLDMSITLTEVQPNSILKIDLDELEISRNNIAFHTCTDLYNDFTWRIQYQNFEWRPDENGFAFREVAGNRIYLGVQDGLYEFEFELIFLNGNSYSMWQGDYYNYAAFYYSNPRFMRSTFTFTFNVYADLLPPED
jgi:hypothetical protein